MKSPNILLCCFLVALASLSLHAQNTTPVLSIQGLVQKSFGAALTDGTYNLTFKLYESETGTDVKWTETQSVEVTGGVYSALLGSVEALNLTFNTTYYLGVTVQGGTEMLPRARLTSTPYALSLIGQGNIFPSSGAIGAGTNAPADGYQLHVKKAGGDAKLLVESTSNNAVLEFKKGTNKLGLTYNGSNLALPGIFNATTLNATDINATNLNTTSTFTMKDAAGNSQWFFNLNPAFGGLNIAETGQAEGRIFIQDGTGNVGISTIDPKSRLHVLTNSSNVVSALFQSAGGWNAVQASNGTVLTEIAAHTDHGFIGTNSNHELRIRSGGFDRMRFQTNGNICHNGSFGACSDRRYKRDFQPIEGALAAVTQMRGLHYRWQTENFPEKGFPETTQIGFIAQELEPLFPELVLTGDDGYKSVDYARLTPVLVEAMKEQQAQIEALKNEVTALKTQAEKVAALEAKFAALSASLEK